MDGEERAVTFLAMIGKVRVLIQDVSEMVVQEVHRSSLADRFFVTVQCTASQFIELRSSSPMQETIPAAF
jgi:hypothetical protein